MCPFYALVIPFSRAGWYCLSGSDCHRFKAIISQYDQIVLKKNVVKALEKIMGEYEQA